MGKVKVDDLVDLGLKPYEAKAVLGLMALPDRQGTSTEIAETGGLPRTSVYGTMDGLIKRGLAETVATVGLSKWTVGSWDVLLSRLDWEANQSLAAYRRRLRSVAQKVQAGAAR